MFLHPASFHSNRVYCRFLFHNAVCPSNRLYFTMPQRQLRDWLLSPSPSSNNLCPYRSTVATVYNSFPVKWISRIWGLVDTPVDACSLKYKNLKLLIWKLTSTPRLTTMWPFPGVAGLGHYKNRAEKPRTADSSVGSTSAVLNTARLEGQAVCKTERLQALSTPLGPFDKNYSRKRLREHSLDRTDCESSMNEALVKGCVVYLQHKCIKVHFNVILMVLGVKNRSL